MSSITSDVGILLGRSPLSAADQDLADLLVAWVQDKIQSAATVQLVTPDPLAIDRVVTKAVARYMGMPHDGLTQKIVQVDDASITRSFARPASAEIGDVEILDEWWAELGLVGTSAPGVFSVRPSFEPDTAMWATL
jgi:hypothetical protein